jgi:mono/diheme cytochrome c family protein
MTGASRLSALTVFVALCTALPARAAPAPAVGQELYRRYCATCHGADGRADGPAASSLSPPPTDLTRLDSSVRELMRAIDGRRTIRAHGTSTMPVWGTVFERTMAGERHPQRTTLLQVEVLAEYVRTLQAR